MTISADNAHKQWLASEAEAEAMIPLIGHLNRENKVVISIHGHSLINKSVVQILKAHRFARQIDDIELDPADSLKILKIASTLDLGACSLDLASLQRKFEAAEASDLEAWLKQELAPVIGKKGQIDADSQDVVLYGFGRIGRLLARILLERSTGPGPQLRAVVVRKNTDNDLYKRASLLRRDSVHGAFKGIIRVDEENSTIIANGTPIKFIYASDPSEIDYTAYGIDNAIVVDNTGRWRDKDSLSRHLQAKGAARVLLTAPGKGVKNIVCGVNDDIIDDNDTVLSAASCTTNAITPVLAVMDEVFGVKRGHVETVHSFTNDQNLIDNFHKGDRRGRSAALNMVLTETGAAKAVSKALPQLEGRLTGNAIRVPTPDVSMAILSLQLDKPVGSKEELNNLLRERSLRSHLRRQIDFTDSHEVVSTDFVGSRAAGVVDGLATITSGDNNAILYVWYDNEFGYSCQVIRVLETMVGDQLQSFPAEA
ncbi:glyceraldehyde-3-phosphate dehydrogenase [Rothia sp. 32237D007AR]